MKKCIVLNLFLIPLAMLAFSQPAVAHSADVSFTWDANHPNDQVVKYRLYRSNTSGDHIRIVDDPNSTYFVGEKLCRWDETGCEKMTESDVPDGTWYWVLTAVDQYDFESAVSDEVSKFIDSQDPAPPQSFSIWEVIISWIRGLFGNFRIATG